jgi:hypothetical protein
MKTFIPVIFLALLTACAGGIEGEERFPTGAQRDGLDQNAIYEDRESIFGEDGLKILDGGRGERASTDAVTVNSFLWRAALDTVSFMPLASVDPFGGVILTDWYTDPAEPDERYKLNVFVIGSQLRSDAIRVSTFQQKNRNGNWMEMQVDPSIATKIEDAILTRARQLRIAQSQ